MAHHFKRAAVISLAILTPLVCVLYNKYSADSRPVPKKATKSATVKSTAYGTKKPPAKKKTVRTAKPPITMSTNTYNSTTNLCLFGYPEGAPASNRLLERQIYVLSNNGKTKFADWAVYAVRAETIGPTRSRSFNRDRELPKTETLSASDYLDIEAKLRMDRGHQVPLASFTRSPYWKLLDELSNVTPQGEELNEGPWLRLEDAERSLAKKEPIVYVQTGPLYERKMPRLPHAKQDHTIPSGYWKVVAITQSTNVLVAAFIMDQTTPRTANFCDFLVAVRDAEKRSHLNLFPRLDQAVQNQIEMAPGTQLAAKLGCDCGPK